MKRRRSRALGEPTKKDFQAIAQILCEHDASEAMVGAFSRHFHAQNPRFDAGRFNAAVANCKRRH